MNRSINLKYLKKGQKFSWPDSDNVCTCSNISHRTNQGYYVKYSTNFLKDLVKKNLDSLTLINVHDES